MKTIIEVLMERDNMSQEDAEDLLNEAKEEACNIIEEDGSLEDIEQILMDYFSLEPDYIFELIDI
jgi:hypothetical protein